MLCSLRDVSHKSSIRETVVQTSQQLDRFETVVLPTKGSFQFIHSMTFSSYSILSMVSEEVASSDESFEILQEEEIPEARNSVGEKVSCSDKRADFSLSDFKLEKELGRGSFSAVYQVFKKTTQTLHALKVTFLDKKNVLRFVENEVAHLRQLNHPGIVQYEGHLHLESRCRFYTLLELDLGQELFECAGKFGYKRFRYVAAQIIHVLGYLEEKRILHRDLKLENILINNRDHIKLIDFGFAKVLRERERAYTKLGTIPYLSPELLGDEVYEFPSQIWSCGVVLNALCFKCFPFNPGTPSAVDTMYNSIKERVFQKDPSPEMDRRSLFYTDLVKTFIRGCFQWNPEVRSTIQDLKNHSFFQLHVFNGEEQVAVQWDQLYS